MVLNIRNLGNIWVRLVCFQKLKKLTLATIWTDNCDRTFPRLDYIESVGVTMSTMIAFIVNVNLMQV